MNIAASRTPTVDEVLSHAKEIVDAYAATDTDRYFSTFDPEASFVFHPEDRRLDSRAEYEDKWARWIEDGWRVVSCESSEPLVQTFPGGAVFSHTVNTTVDTAGKQESYTERESIVFRVAGDGLAAIHEHLSTPTV